MVENETYENSTDMKTNGPRRRSIRLAAGLLSGLALVASLIIVACSPGVEVTQAPGEATVAVIQGTLAPTSTPTPRPTATVTPTPLGSTPVAVEPAEGWTFEGVRVQPDPGLGGLVVYGEAINDSGAPQRILGLQGNYYDAQGGAITPQEISDYWPIETVPPGWRMPFELTLMGPTAVDRVELQIVTEDSDEPLRTDFEVSQLEGVRSDGEYCVTGRARNLGQPLGAYVMVVAVLYDAEDQVINWGIGYERASENLVGDETVAMGACADHFNQVVARYELRAWGE